MRKERSIGLLYAVTLILSACSLLYELLIAQTLSLLAANTVVWYSLTVGTYLGAMGLGAFLLGTRYRRTTAWIALFKVELLLSVVGALAVVLVHAAHVLHAFLQVHDMAGIAIVVFFGTAFVVIFLVGLLTGIELPLLIRLGNEASGENKVTNRVLGLDYIGALVGGFAFPLILVPYLELFTIGFLIAIVNLLVALAVLAVFLDERDPVMLKSGLSGALLVALIAAMLHVGSIQNYFLKKYYFFLEASYDLSTLIAPMPEFPDVLRTSSTYQKIDIVHDVMGFPEDKLIRAYSTKLEQRPTFPRDRILYLNLDYQLLSTFEEVYHESFVHVPIIINGRAPERVLVLGGGDGLLTAEILKYPHVREVVQVELDPRMIELARTDPILTAMNLGALDDPRVQIVIADAFQFVRTRQGGFDAIYMDFPVPADYNLSKLYSREFYHFVRGQLSEDGYAVFDAPGAGQFSWPDENGNQTISDDNAWEEYYHTIRMAGFETVVPFVSTLEVDNPEATAILAASPLRGDFLRSTELDPTTPDEVWMREVLIENSLTLQEGFIVMWKDTRRPELTYHDPGVPLHFLNEERFSLAVGHRFPVPERIDPSKVNSIMRPTLPSTPVWNTRLAWQID